MCWAEQSLTCRFFESFKIAAVQSIFKLFQIHIPFKNFYKSVIDVLYKRMNMHLKNCVIVNKLQVALLYQSTETEH